MNWVLVKIQESNVLSPSNHPLYLVQPPPPPLVIHDSNGGSGGGLFNLNNKVSPSILLVIIILALIFFISGLLHLLVRFLLRPTTRDPDELDNVTAFQGQLQQLFHLHDAGVDQSFIDTLPVFNYKSIIGVKDPFDCAVCLCEFEPDDKLRWLPKCSHAFHMECIDTWLLSHSTCPLCRASLLPDFSSSSLNNNHTCSPIVFVLESDSGSSRENNSNSNSNNNNNVVPYSHELLFDSLRRNNSISRLSLSSSLFDDNNMSVSDFVVVAKSCDEIHARDGEIEKVVQVKLGKFKNVDIRDSSDDNEEGSSNNIDSRRCFSMGSFAYILDETTSLHVPIRQTSSKKQSIYKPNHRQAMSECGCDDSIREFNGFEAFKFAENPMQNINNENKIVECKRESFSVSKIWLRGKRDHDNANSRRAFSFRLPTISRTIPIAAQPDGSAATENGGTRRTTSEIDVVAWEKNEGFDEENQCYNRLEYQPKTPSFARRTLLWLMGKQNKVVHSSYSSNL